MQLYVRKKNQIVLLWSILILLFYYINFTFQGDKLHIFDMSATSSHGIDMKTKKNLMKQQ